MRRSGVIALAVAAQVAAATPLLSRRLAPEVRTTLLGCKCQTSWDSGIPGAALCETACCNPDSDPRGDWCKVEDPSCEDETWGYCASGTQASRGDCWDSPTGWHDSEGDTCGDYVSGGWCTSSGALGANWMSDWGTFQDYEFNQATASMACCGCGGGTAEKPSDSTDLNGCHDTPPGWSDKEGDVCTSYAAGQWCNAQGQPGPGWDNQWGTIQDYASQGKTAVEACCACGGGSSGGGGGGGGGSNGGCQDRADWADSDGDHCSAYGMYEWCNADGSYGSGWHSVWGEFPASSGANGVTAVIACCACGGGSTAANGGQGGGPPPTPAPTPTWTVPEGVRQTWNGCACKKEWTDSRGHTCSEFCCNPGGDQNGEWCKVEQTECEEAEWGYCTPERSGSGQCINDPIGWRDTDDDDCYHYVAGHWCTPDGQVGSGWQAAWGSFSDYATNGHAATAACCGCGGGSTHAAAHHTASTANGEACRDFPPQWTDSEGDGCDSYEAGQWCTQNGQVGSFWQAAWGTIEDYAGTDKATAFQACCACGGGTAASHETAHGATCEDEADWADRDGDDCSQYLMYAWCNSTGGYGIGWHTEWGPFPPKTGTDITADRACCVCGGGTRAGQQTAGHGHGHGTAAPPVTGGNRNSPTSPPTQATHALPGAEHGVKEAAVPTGGSWKILVFIIAVCSGIGLGVYCYRTKKAGQDSFSAKAPSSKFSIGGMFGRRYHDLGD